MWGRREYRTLMDFLERNFTSENLNLNNQDKGFRL